MNITYDNNLFSYIYMKTRRRVIKRNNVKTIKKGGDGLNKEECYK